MSLEIIWYVEVSFILHGDLSKWRHKGFNKFDPRVMLTNLRHICYETFDWLHAFHFLYYESINFFVQAVFAVNPDADVDFVLKHLTGLPRDPKKSIVQLQENQGGSS